MKTKTQIQNVSGEPSDAPEITLIAILVSMVLLRILDVFSPPASEHPDCTATFANRAVIPCAILGDRNWGASSTQAIASLNGRR